MVVNEKLYTIHEYEAYANAHPDALLELIDGRVVAKMTSVLHAKIVGWILHLLIVYLQQHPEIKGHWGTEGTFQPEGDNKNGRRPDVHFWRTNAVASDDAHVEGMPDFAVEVKSKSNTYEELRDKAKFYIQHGRKLVWLVYPTRQIVEVYFADGTNELYDKEQTLTGGDVLPNFQLNVIDIFEMKL